MIDKSLAPFLFHQGTNYATYEYLGCHMIKEGDVFNYTFRVWAPGADSVSVVGDFCSWDVGLPMTRITEKGVWEATFETDHSIDASFYKYAVSGHGQYHLKADPYAFSSQTLEETASIIVDDRSYNWKDSEWMKNRHKFFHERSPQKNKLSHFYPSPMNIYEMHAASWKSRDGKSLKDGQHYLSWREIAADLTGYVKRMGYTHIELLPVMEHPFDGSWGYQVCGYYAPSSRYGTPVDFKYFIDTLHEAGIGIILDWVPAHFPKDRHGLYEFDGAPLYEYQGWDRMEHKGWGTHCFDVGRNEVQSFLISNALYWFREFHIDGLRIDAVASMLYLDYDREPGQWIPAPDGSNRNPQAISFFQKLNTTVFAEFPDVLMVAEESTSWPMITKPVSEGGLGFNFKWNMGWANDMFEYVAKDPIYRQYEHTKLTFPLMYAFSENYVLPVSHDEVVHGKKSLIDKMNGSYEDKFRAMRAFMVNMMTMPGKKLTFMGTEFAQFREWDFENQLEWFMLGYDNHSRIQKFIADLNDLYLASPELWEIDDSWDGFQWIEADRKEDNLVAYKRRSISGKELTIVVSYSPVDRCGYILPVEKRGKYKVLLNSNDSEYGGNGGDKFIKTVTHKSDSGNVNILKFDLPPYGAMILRKVPYNVK